MNKFGGGTYHLCCATMQFHPRSASCIVRSYGTDDDTLLDCTLGELGEISGILAGVDFVVTPAFFLAFGM